MNQDFNPSVLNTEPITKISQVTPEVTLFLRALGFSNYYIIQIFGAVGEAAVALTEDDPYWLLEEFPRMGFKKVDEVAFKLGISRENPHRVQAAIRYIMAVYAAEGHTFAPMEELSLKTAEYTGVSSELVLDCLEDMVFDGSMQIADLEGRKVVYFYAYYKAECISAGKLANLAWPDSNEAKYGIMKGLAGMIADSGKAHKKNAQQENLDYFIRKSQAENGIELTDEQVEAVRSSLSTGVSIITGGPGTGKTTVIKAIISILESQRQKVGVCAPTGRAAKRIMETSGHDAMTIHRLLEYGYDEFTGSTRFRKNRENPLEYKAVIVDEASMMDIMLCEALCEAMPLGTRLILVGDADQLPSVGAGNVLSDLIESEYFYTTRLTQIHRQSAKSHIVTNAHLINKGEYPEYDDDFELVRCDKQADIAANMIEIASRYSADQVQILTPTKKNLLGTAELNIRLQELFNPAKEGVDEMTFGKTVFRVGDRVMQMRNNYKLSYKFFADSPKTKKLNPMVSTQPDSAVPADARAREISPWAEQRRKSDTQNYNTGDVVYDGKGVFNGEVGIVKEVDAENKIVTVLYDDERWVQYTYNLLDEIQLAYAVTVHKSQGSEFPVVVIPATWFPPGLSTRSLIYTAITRGKKKVYIVGNPEYINAMVENNQSKNRNSGLAVRLKGLY